MWQELREQFEREHCQVQQLDCICSQGHTTLWRQQRQENHHTRVSQENRQGFEVHRPFDLLQR